jgi:hypothetical protein
MSTALVSDAEATVAVVTTASPTASTALTSDVVAEAPAPAPTPAPPERRIPWWLVFLGIGAVLYYITRRRKRG